MEQHTPSGDNAENGEKTQDWEVVAARMAGVLQAVDAILASKTKTDADARTRALAAVDQAIRIYVEAGGK